VVTTAVTAAVEVQAEVNGVIEVVEKAPTAPQVATGDDHVIVAVAEEQQQAMVALPPLYDMDLERMHVDLYKSKYLTTEDFLNDVHKIVHNALSRQDEDPDRLYKAQAMLTAAEVSIHDFDPQLKLECDRMAVRERQRREARKKSKSKGKSQDDNNHNGQNGSTYAPGTRRSARHNGLEPECKITDPLKLERRLKRQRSNEAGGAESVGSEEEHSEGHGHTVKRSKVGSDDGEDGDDPLDIVGPTSIPRPVGVRFRIEDLEPMVPFTPQRHEHEPRNANANANRMEIDLVSPTPRKVAGFDASLLNPVASPDDVFSCGGGGVNGMVGESSRGLVTPPVPSVHYPGTSSTPIHISQPLPPPAPSPLPPLSTTEDALPPAPTTSDDDDDRANAYAATS
jgi:hypothetical protein